MENGASLMMKNKCEVLPDEDWGFDKVLHGRKFSHPSPAGAQVAIAAAQAMRWLICDVNSAKDAATAWHIVTLSTHSLICKKKHKTPDASRASPGLEELETEIDLESVSFVLAVAVYAARVYPAILLEAP